MSFVAFLSMSVSFLNWGLSLVFGGLLARAIARRTDLRVDYRALGAAAFMGLGAVWALGMSSSAAQLQATASSLPPELLKITGVLDFGTTIFTWQSLLMCAIIIALTVVIAHFSAPRGAAIMTAEDLDVDLDDQTEEVPPRSRPGEWLEYSRILPVLAGLMTLGWLISQLLTKPVLTVVSSLNGYLLVFLILGLVLHGTPRKFLQAVAKAVPATGGILVQFPLYAAMAAILTKAEGRGGQTVSDQLAELFTNVGGGGGFAVVIALYTVVLGLFVPSGGGKWLVEAPYVMQSATDVEMNLGWTVQIYNVAEALPNLINPFFMLPLLAVLGLRARDLVGFTFLQFIFHLPVVLALVWLLGMTFDFVPACRAPCTVSPACWPLVSINLRGCHRKAFLTHMDEFVAVHKRAAGIRRGDGLADEQGAVEVYADDRVDYVGVHFVKSLLSQYSRVVDEDVDSAERVERAAVYLGAA